MCRGPKAAIAAAAQRGGQQQGQCPALLRLIGTVEKATADVFRVAQKSDENHNNTPPLSPEIPESSALAAAAVGSPAAAPSSPQQSAAAAAAAAAAVGSSPSNSPAGKKRTRGGASSSSSHQEDPAVGSSWGDEGGHNGATSIGTRTKRRRRKSLEGASCPVDVDDVSGAVRNDDNNHSHNPNSRSRSHNVVHHDYHDYSSSAAPPGGAAGVLFVEPEVVEQPMTASATAAACVRRGRGGISSPFPTILHQMLDHADHEGYSDVVSWQSHGRAFHVHQQDRFVREVMPRFFRQTRFSSFQRQLSLYGFLRLTRKGRDHGAYYHEFCLRGKPHLCVGIQRKRVKGYWVRQSSSPDTEPNFYRMPVVRSTAADAAVVPGPTPLAPGSIPYYPTTTTAAVRNSSPASKKRASRKQQESSPSSSPPLPMPPLPMPPLSASLPIDHEFMLKNLSFGTPCPPLSLQLPALAFTTATATNLPYRPESGAGGSLKDTSSARCAPLSVSSSDLFVVGSMDPFQPCSSSTKQPLPMQQDLCKQQLQQSDLDGLFKQPIGLLPDLPLDDQEDLVAFLSDVDLDSDDDDEDIVYRNEDELGRIYATKTARPINGI